MNFVVKDFLSLESISFEMHFLKRTFKKVLTRYKWHLSLKAWIKKAIEIATLETKLLNTAPKYLCYIEGVKFKTLSVKYFSLEVWLNKPGYFKFKQNFIKTSKRILSKVSQAILNNMNQAMSNFDGENKFGKQWIWYLLKHSLI